MVTDEFESVGVKILGEALRSPIKILIENKTGLSAPPIIDKIEKTGDFFMGFDVQQEKIVDMMDAGVVDSLKVVTTYLQDSVSLSGLLLTTESLVAKDKSYEPLSLDHY